MKLYKLASVAAALVLSTSANASTVFNVDGIDTLEWLELTSTAGMTRSTVETMTSSGSLQGWRYATRSEVETLYDSLWGGTTETWSADNYSGARTFFNTFGISELYSGLNNSGYRLDGYTEWSTFFGVDGDACVTASNSCVASVLISDTAYGSTSNEGWFHDSYGLSNGVDLANYQQSSGDNINYASYASHLVRVTVVPIPAAIWLFGSGLIGLIGLARRKRHA